MMAYHVYAPLKWDGQSKLPMVLVLHGNTRDQDYYFDRDDHDSRQNGGAAWISGGLPHGIPAQCRVGLESVEPARARRSGALKQGESARKTLSMSSIW